RGLGTRLRDLISRASSPRGSGTLTTPPALTPPNPPLAKRLNRNALTVAAVVMGMTVIACLVVLQKDSRPIPRMGSDPAVAEQTRPTFLDRPAPSTALDQGLDSAKRQTTAADVERETRPATTRGVSPGQTRRFADQPMSTTLNLDPPQASTIGRADSPR